MQTAAINHGDVGRSRHPRTVGMKTTTVIAHTTMVVIGSIAPASGLHERADVVQGAGVEGQQIVVSLKVRPELGRGVERLAEPPCHGVVMRRLPLTISPIGDIGVLCRTRRGGCGPARRPRYDMRR